MKIKTLLALSLTANMLYAGSAIAWEPKKSIEIVVGFSAGGSSDIVARSLADAASPFFPVPLVVVNKPGAAGVIAAEYVARQPADGYTLLLAGGSENTSVPNHRKVNYDPSTSFTPIIHAVRLRIMLSVKNDSEFKTFPQLVEYAKKNPDKVSYGSSGIGGLYHSAMLAVDKAAGIQTYHIPYKGGADVAFAVLGNQVQLGLSSPDEIKGHFDAGKMRSLALTSKERYSKMPDVPTLKELGYDVYLENMKGLVAPGGLPPEIYTYLHDAFKKGMETEKFKQLANKANLEVTYMDGPAFGAAMKSMSDTIAAALK